MASLADDEALKCFLQRWEIYIDDDLERLCEKFLAALQNRREICEYFSDGTYGIRFSNCLTQGFFEAFDDARGTIRIHMSAHEADRVILRATAALAGLK